MSWVLADLLMFVGSVVVYLAIRQAARRNMPIQYNNLAWFGVEAVVFGIASAVVHPAFSFTPMHITLLVLAGVVFSYVSSIMSLKSIALAPNAGYSLVLSKSYVVFTSFAAVPLFGAKLPATALLAILLIVGFSMLIMINPKEAHGAKSSVWVPLALGSFFCWGLLSLTAKYLFTQGMTPLAFLTSIAIIVLACVLVEMRHKRVSMRPVAQHWGSCVLIGGAAIVFNYFNFAAIASAPNVGFVNATNAASIAAVTVLSIILFKDEFSWRKLVGVFGVVAGLFMLFLA